MQFRFMGTRTSWSRGKKEEEEDDAYNVQDNGPSGQFGVFCANWGGKWKMKQEDDYMNDDIAGSVCQLLVLQEVEPEFCSKMQGRAEKRHRATMGPDDDINEVGPEPIFVCGLGLGRSPRE